MSPEIASSARPGTMTSPLSALSARASQAILQEHPRSDETGRFVANGKPAPSAAKKAPARGTTARKSTARKSAARKATAATTTTRTAAARKATARKAVARKATARKTAARKTATARTTAVARKTVARKTSVARKTVARKAVARKRPAAAKATARKTSTARTGSTKPLEVVAWREDVSIRMVPRTITAGRVKVRTKVTSKKVSKTVGMQYEECTIIREKIKPSEYSKLKMQRQFGKSKDHDLELRLKMDQAVVTKKLVPQERIKLQVKTVRKSMKVTETARSEQLQVVQQPKIKAPKAADLIRHETTTAAAAKPAPRKRRPAARKKK
ncbi:MAG: DUF2382 domain-containing protein [Mycobacteriaceae bacterium]|nr:DUF2382 domain-containing protein [Mycobacteriaceae bacterium]